MQQQRQTLQAQPAVLLVVSLEGNIGCGKSSVLKRLAEEPFRFPVVPEPVEEWWPLLQRFYDDPRR